MKRIHLTRLGFQEGSSDKIYEAELLEVSPDAYLVNFRFGKRGATLKESSKTPQPVPFDKAAKVFKSLLVSKINKGYELLSGFDPFDDLPKPGSKAENASTQVPVPERIMQRLQAYLEMINHPTVPSFNWLDGAKQLLQRFTQFSTPDKTVKPSTLERIQGHSLSRTIWQAGLWRVKESVPLLAQCIAPGEDLRNYSIIWALGRIGDPQVLPLITDLIPLLPENMRYLGEDVKLALSTPEQRQQAIGPALDWDESQRVLTHIGRFAPYHGLACQALDAETSQQTYAALAWRGLEDRFQPFLAQVTLDHTWEHFLKDLPEDLREQVQGERLQHQDLAQALEAISQHQMAVVRALTAPTLEEDTERYQTAIASLDLSQFNYEMYSIRSMNLRYLEKRTRTRLLTLLKGTDPAYDFEALIKRINTYRELLYYTGKRLSPEQEHKAWAVVEHYGGKAALQAALKNPKPVSNGSELYYLSYNFYKNHVPAELNSKRLGELPMLLQRLFSDRQAQLKQALFAERDQELVVFNQHFLQAYQHHWLAPENRTVFAAMMHGLPFNQDTFPLVRKLYKLAEFRQDHALLAVLNYRFEVSPALSPNSPSWRPKNTRLPFSPNTRQYLRRRMLRTLKEWALHTPQQYPWLAAHILAAVQENTPCFAARTETVYRYVENDEGEFRRKGIRHFPAYASHLALGSILWKHSVRYQLKDGYWCEGGGRQQDTERPEAYPELWDQNPQAAWWLLKAAQAEISNDFALAQLKRQPDFAAQQTRQEEASLLDLLDKPYENTQLWALQYLDLNRSDCLQKVLASDHGSVRELGLAALRPELLQANPGFWAQLLLSPHGDVQKGLQLSGPPLAGHEVQLSAQVLALLLAEDAPPLTEAAFAQARTVLVEQLKALAPPASIESLLKTDQVPLQRLGLAILVASPLSAEQSHGFLPLLQASEDAEVRAGAILLFSKLPQTDQQAALPVLLQAAQSEDSAERQAASAVIVGIREPGFQLALFQGLVPTLFRAESSEGLHADLLQLVEHLHAIYGQVDSNVLWRLLQARSKLAQQVGGLVVQAALPEAFSLHQKILLSKNPNLSARHWALETLKAELDQHPVLSLVALLDNPWEDSRQAAIALLKTLPEHHWQAETVVAICDQVYLDVQSWGRELLAKYEADPVSLIQHLSQHPSQRMQHWVSDRLTGYSQKQPELLLQLKAYFATVLCRVNQGRILKDRVIHLLLAASETHRPVAEMTRDLLAAYAMSATARDKTLCLTGLLDLQKWHPDLSNPLQLIPARKVGH